MTPLRADCPSRRFPAQRSPTSGVVAELGLPVNENFGRYSTRHVPFKEVLCPEQ